MRSSSEWPSDAAVSFLSDALEPAPPVEVLFEPEGMRGDHPSSREKRQELAAAAGRSPESAGFKFHQGAGAGNIGFEDEQSPTCTADWHNHAVLTDDAGCLNPEDPQSKRIFAPDSCGPTLSSGTSEGMNIQPSVLCMADDNAKAAIDEGMCGSLKVGGSAPWIAQGRMVVRRLTPMECERLQGFPTEVRLKAEDMTSDELIACALANGDITCDLANGKVYGTRGPGGKPLDEKRELGFVHPSGYVHINLSSNGSKKQVRAHRVVYIAANGHIPDGMVVDHINNDKSDNRICNLQLLTAEENSRKAADDGRYLSGEDNPRSKITAEVRSRIAHDYRTSGMTYRELAQKYGVSKSRIGQIVNECDWTKVPYRGKPAEECPDGPRYKAIGNSFAVPVVRWIGERIAMADKEGE